MKNYKITVLRGDGIGPEIVNECIKVLDKAGEKFGFSFDYNDQLLGGCAIDATGVPYPAETAAACKASDAVLLGAVGVQLGTRFLVAKECGVHQNYKNKVLKANDIATMSTGKRLGHPVRSIKNPYTKEYFKLEYSDISDEELEAYGRGSLYRAAVEGDEKTGCFLAGQIAGMVNKEQTAKEIIEEIFTQAEDVLKGATKWVK